jgi:DNA-directed RNA polymerase subunit RPC12/RpoP
MAARAKKGCKTCGKTVRDHGHLCAPLKAKDHTCDWCGSLIMDARHMCDTKLKKLSYICNSCGRLALAPQYLCQPRKIKKA